MTQVSEKRRSEWIQYQRLESYSINGNSISEISYWNNRSEQQRWMFQSYNPYLDLYICCLILSPLSLSLSSSSTPFALIVPENLLNFFLFSFPENLPKETLPILEILYYVSLCNIHNSNVKLDWVGDTISISLHSSDETFKKFTDSQTMIWRIKCLRNKKGRGKVREYVKGEEKMIERMREGEGEMMMMEQQKERKWMIINFWRREEY